MKHIEKIRIIPLLLMAALCLGLLSGCGSFDAAAYVKGGLDVLYLGEVSEEYLSLVVDSREDCLAMYEENILNEAENFGKMFYVDVNSQPDEALVALYKEIFAQSRYEVGEAQKTASGYAVDVTIYPIDVFRSSYEALDMYDRDFTQRFSDGEYENISGSELQKEYLRGMIEIISGELPNLGYLESVNVTVHLTLDADGVCHIDDGDYAELHNSIIAY